ncbi:MAG: hypothetical protein DI536_30425 [Archangium gephyra]|uniref:DUF1565 domain-containing protein n=1 Tax=Archangium gephyra TaxID=48 RepID=A0A2W5UBP5_9BACT|nr:MAG: hypothetical protein DI536_30425 [Archangium gephyra]
MRHNPKLHLAIALSFVAFLQACNCQRRTAVDTPLAEGEACETDDRCESGLCDSVMGAPKVCLRRCISVCRGTEICTELPGDRYACVPERAGLCKPCTQNSDCPQPADKCIVLGETSFCGRDCSFDETCPSSYRCADATTSTGQPTTKQCQPTSGTCDCTSATSGQQKPCEVTNNFGTCTGISTCLPPDGYTSCNARTPTAEVCNGIDDNCNGQIDEDLGTVTCGMGECIRSVAACIGGAAQTCTPGMPGTELCNGRDDDCDGMVDDGFLTQSDPLHCGACNMPCVLTNAIPACNMGMCAIGQCQPGWSDVDHNPANGCEYPCTPSDAGVEVCNGVDDNCDGRTDEGFDLVNDPTNCGACNLTCSMSGNTVATYACNARTCAVGTCVTGRGNCDQNYSNGCEVDLQVDTTHCGVCGNTCNTPNATASCVNGTCGVGTCNANFANCNGTVADGCEINTNTDVNHCGDCATVCSAPNAASSCSNGSCAYTCNANYWDVDGLASNGCEYNCIRTAGGVEQCDGIDNDCDNRIDEDFDLTTSSAHCGQCNRACSAPFATTTCSASNCGITQCDTGRANCNNLYVDGCEINTRTDIANCGTCGNACSAANGAPACNNGICGIACGTGFADCNGQIGDGCEVNLNTTLTHCGTCGNQCNLANATPRCQGGECQILSCNPGFADCNGVASDGCEVNITNSPGHCGACNAACNGTNGTPTCSNSSCGITCNANFDNCDNNASNGCEVNTGTSLGNCGACGNVCNANNGAASCSNGSCGIACGSGFANCNGSLSDGCEVNTNASVAHCGACNNACTAANATAACSNGDCTIGSCSAPFRDCNGQVSDGCEINSSNNVNNCGACGTVCAVANATPACVSSACAVGTCNTGFRDCNSQVVDGCEINTTNNVNHCGACGNQCTVANGTPGCSGSACTVASCSGTYRNCNNQVSDGCEVNTADTVAHCGACGAVCAPANAVPACTSSTCGIAACLPGWVNLNGSVADGCEYSCTPSGPEVCDTLDNDCDGAVDEGFALATDINNCGACGTVCSPANAVPACAASTCNIAACTAGFANCNGAYGDGCEVNLTNNVSNCGSCGNACNLANASPACVSSTCAVGSCNAGFANCNGLAADGCERNLTNDVNNCAACGNVCPSYPNMISSCSGSSCGAVCAPNRWNLDGNLANGCEYACTFLSASDEPDPGFVDANCDGIDGIASQAVFVTTTGNDFNPGTMAQPKRTVQAGIAAAGGARPNVLVSEGTYDEAISLVNGVNVYGAYSANNGWARSAAYVTRLRNGVIGSSRIVTVSGSALSNPTRVANVTIEAVATSVAQVSVYGLYCINCTAFTLESSIVISGSAGPGVSGSVGFTGASGGIGGSGGSSNCGTNGSGLPGGSGGLSSCGRTGGAGGRGGNSGDNDGVDGSPGNFGVPGGTRGFGGDPGTSGNSGATGPAGGNGANGAGGSGGNVVGNFFVTNSGGTGALGGDGNGGGGGGGSGGQGCFLCNNARGNGGGGGGGGGCGGGGATGGTGGGSSFGVFLVNSSGAVVTGCSITSGNGGQGGAGGTGGNGGWGGERGQRGSGCPEDVGYGGYGGYGGAGGRGGHGGGGAGGVSYGVYRSNSTVTLTGNTITNGSGGFGGTSQGTAGVNGSAGTVF